MAARRPKEVVELQGMDVDALLALRAEIDVELDERAEQLRKQLQALGHGEGAKRGRLAKGGRGSVLKGIKVPPRFVGPNGETWAGRGAHPKWLKALLDDGHSIEKFAVDEAAAEATKVAAAAATGLVAKKRRKVAAGKKRGRSKA